MCMEEASPIFFHAHCSMDIHKLSLPLFPNQHFNLIRTQNRLHLTGTNKISRFYFVIALSLQYLCRM